MQDIKSDVLFISSRNNNRIKSVVKLHDKKERENEKKFVFEGIKLTEEYINKIGIPDEIFVREDAFLRFDLLKKLPKEKITCVSGQVYDKITKEKSPQGILCVADFLTNVRTYTSDVAGGGIILESVRDAGNLGTIIRTAAAFGVSKVFISSDCADVYNEKTLRAAMGAVFFVDIFICDHLKELVSDISALGGRVFAAMPRGGAKILGNVSFKKYDAVVIGNEGTGISKELSQLCDAITIPMASGAESLNAAIAASVIMWEMNRLQKLLP